LKITAASITPFCARLVRPLSTAQGRIESREGFVLTLESDSGARGMGEASPAYWLGGERIAETRRALESIVQSVERHRDSDELRRLIDENSSGGSPLTPAGSCALDTALIDLSARLRGVPMASVLGGESIGPVQVCALLAGLSPEELTKEARIAVGRRYTSFKLKVGARAIAADAKQVASLRMAIGNDFSIRLDANRAWTLDQAEVAMRAFQPYGIEFLEEPLRSPQPGDMRRLSDATGVALALDESISGAAALGAFVEHDVVDYLVLKAARLGGPTRCAEIARLAGTAGIKVVITDSIESAVGMSTAVHLASALSRRGTAVGAGGARFFPAVSFCGVEFPSVSQVLPDGPGLNVSAYTPRKGK
jgi:o-succinylbenzoate synthase